MSLRNGFGRNYGSFCVELIPFFCNTFCVYKLIRTIGVLSDEKNYFVYYGINVEHGSCPRQKAKDILPVT